MRSSLRSRIVSKNEEEFEVLGFELEVDSDRVRPPSAGPNEWRTVRMQIEVSRESTVEGKERRSGYPTGSAAAIFVALQFLDLATTLAVFGRGGVELNPVIRFLMPWTGRLLAIVLSKATLLSVVLLLNRRRRLLRFANVFYTAVVVWNIVVFFILRQTSSL